MKGLVSEKMQIVNLRKNCIRDIQRSLANHRCVVESERQPFQRIIYTSTNRVNNCVLGSSLVFGVFLKNTDYFGPRWSHLYIVQRSERYQKLGCKKIIVMGGTNNLFDRIDD